MSSAELNKLGTYNYTNSYQGRNTETEVSLYWTLVDYERSNQEMDYRKALAEDKIIAGDWVDFDYFLRILETGETSFYSLNTLGISDEVSGNTLIAKEIIEKLKGVRESILTNPEIVGEKLARVRSERIFRKKEEQTLDGNGDTDSGIRRRVAVAEIKRGLNLR